MKVTFSPTSGGAKSASVVVQHSGSNAPLTIPLSGTGATAPPPTSTVLARVNAGGASVAGSPAWSTDTAGSPSSFVNAAAVGNAVASTGSAITLDPSVPAGTPTSLFQTERYDPGGQPDMQWDFPATAGQTYEVRLFFAETYSGTQAVGARQFDVSIDGALKLNDFDIYAQVGGYRGVMKAFPITSDGNIDIDFTHVVKNPEINAIEIVATGSGGGTHVGFAKSLLAGETSSLPTSLQFGPDGRLYVGQQNGMIKAYTIARNGANNYAVTATETIDLIKTIPNHNDDGTLEPVRHRPPGHRHPRHRHGGAARSIYVTSSDPRIGGGAERRPTLNLDTNSGIISRLTRNGSTWTKLDLVRGLPRSEENHAPNGMALDPATNTLYIAQGGNTNMGAPSNNFALPARVRAVGGDPLGRPQRDRQHAPTTCRRSTTRPAPGTPTPNDPFGGNNGKNQARLVAGGPVQVYSPGFRNPYDVGRRPGGQDVHDRQRRQRRLGRRAQSPSGPSDAPAPTPCSEPRHHEPTSLHLHHRQGYYGGHPNPTRGQHGQHLQRDESAVAGPDGQPGRVRLPRRRAPTARSPRSRRRPTASPSTRRSTSAAR